MGVGCPTVVDLVIFDCDGVLVDSEPLSASVLMDMTFELGLLITPDLFRQDFLGRSFATAARRAEERFGVTLPADFKQQYRKRLLERMKKELQAMPGVSHVLGSMSVPFCLATSSSPERLVTSLDVSGLAGFFGGRCFTASEVQNGKPAPDLFLYAAEKMGAHPSQCLVVEDSEMGVLAARAAGMTVWHFMGGTHIKDGYKLPVELESDNSVSDMEDLRRRFTKLGLCRN